jgi:hypothetical protein
MRCRWVLFLFVCLLAGLSGSAGCDVVRDGDEQCLPTADGCAGAADGDPDDLFPKPEGAACTCLETPPDGFTGLSWYWIGALADMPLCPTSAPFDGVIAYADPSPAVEPPCPATQSVKWGLVARECKITTHDTCETNGMTCAPLPPAGYSLCVYQDDDALCDLPYSTPYRLLRWDSGQECSGMGIQTITLCCAAPDFGH